MSLGVITILSDSDKRNTYELTRSTNIHVSDSIQWGRVGEGRDTGRCMEYAPRRSTGRIFRDLPIYKIDIRHSV